MKGNIAHKWEPPGECWEHAELLDDGGLVAEISNRYFVKVDKDSNVVWKRFMRPHHDIEALNDGSYLLLVYNEPVIYNSRKVKFESILNVPEEGKIIWEFFNPKVNEEDNKRKAIYRMTRVSPERVLGWLDK